MENHEEALTSSDEKEAIASVRRAVASRRERIRTLQLQVEKLTPELRRYERALSYLTGEPVNYKPKKIGSKMEAMKAKAPAGTKLGDGRYEQMSGWVLDFAREHEEFRQIDIRALHGMSSGASSQLFEMMRQRNVVRVARKSGNNKYYRLTSEGLALLNGHAPEGEDS